LARYDGVRYGVRPPGANEARDLADFYQKVRAGFGAEVKRRIILGTFALSAGYSDAYFKRACQVRRLIKNDFDAAFKEVDVIMGPVAPATAYKLGEKISDPLTMYLNDLFAIPANLAGLPAISVPCGKDSKGLPIGLQMMTEAFSEEKLLGIAGAFERGTA
jgi:aspartyl-tRNA(Asn)/glutamyl-tRNA(Gln) amidotransferase subunit A